jgi:Immunity protein 50
MSWIDAVQNGQGVLAVFGGDAPPLTGVDVQRVGFSWEGPGVVLSVSLRDYPADPPAKWAAQQFNTVLLSLNCIDVQDVRLTGWGRQVVADLSLERSGGRVAVRLDSPDATLTLSALAVDVQKVSAYQRGPDDAGW